MFSNVMELDAVRRGQIILRINDLISVLYQLLSVFQELQNMFHVLGITMHRTHALFMHILALYYEYLQTVLPIKIPNFSNSYNFF